MAKLKKSLLSAYQIQSQHEIALETYEITTIALKPRFAIIVPVYKYKKMPLFVITDKFSCQPSTSQIQYCLFIALHGFDAVRIRRSYRSTR